MTSRYLAYTMYIQFRKQMMAEEKKDDDDDDDEFGEVTKANRCWIVGWQKDAGRHGKERYEERL